MFTRFKKMGTEDRIDCVHNYNVFVGILAFVEQGPLYDTIVSACDAATTVAYSGDGPVPRPWEAADLTIAGTSTTIPSPFKTKIAGYLCPSDNNGNNINGVGRTSYRTNRGGDVPLSWDWSEHRGAYSYGGHSLVDFSGFTDGLSNTVLITESAISNDGAYTMYLSALVKEVTSRQAPSECSQYRGKSGMINPVTKGSGSKGYRWGDGRMCYSGVSIMAPPNTPSCIDGTGADSGECYITASSYHPGGVNAVLADGAVRFVSETIDCGDQTIKNGYDQGNTGDTQHWTGPSSYGVWGAAGTKSGSESKSL